VLLRVARRDCRLVLLDEPTAHPDAATERQVVAAMELLRGAHRGGRDTPARRDRSAAARRTPRAVDNAGRGCGMTVPARVLRVVRPRWGRLATGCSAGALASGCAVALLATGAWLIARAAEQPPIAALSLGVVGVRAFAVGRAAFRYLERVMTHDATLRAGGPAGHHIRPVGHLARPDFPALRRETCWGGSWPMSTAYGRVRARLAAVCRRTAWSRPAPSSSWSRCSAGGRGRGRGCAPARRGAAGRRGSLVAERRDRRGWCSRRIVG
jgi:hypothetical protein